MQEQSANKGIPFLRKIVLLFILLAIFGGAGLWYINEYILPTKGKTIFTEILIKATGRKVTVGGIYYNPFRGITIRDLVISDEDRYARNFLEIKKMYFNVLYLPLFKEKKIIIPLIKIDSPKIALTIDDHNKWNFETLSFLNQPQASRQYDVIVSNLSVTDAACAFEDRATEPFFSKEIENLDLRTSISYPIRIKYKLNASLKAARNNSISADGEYDPVRKNFILNLGVKNLPLSEFQPYYAGMPFNSLSGNLTGNTGILFFPGDKLTVETISNIVNLNISAPQGGGAVGAADFNAKGGLDISGKMSLNLKDKTKLPCGITAAVKADNLNINAGVFSLKGGVDVNGKVNFDIYPAGETLPSGGANDKTVITYSADALLRDVKLTGIPNIDGLDKINGKIYLDQNKIWADSIKAIARNLNLIISGSLKDYSKPYIDITAKTELDLSKVNELLTPGLNEYLTDYQISGTGKTSLNVRGELKAKTTPVWTITSELINCSLKAKFLAEAITPINGTIIVKDNFLKLKNIRTAFKKKEYLLDGEIKDFASPSVTASLSSDELTLKTSFRSLASAAPAEGSGFTPLEKIDYDLKSPQAHNVIELHSLTGLTFNRFEGNYKNTNFNLTGDVTELNNPLLKIAGSVNTTINELRPYLSHETKEFLERTATEGPLKAKFDFTGRLNDSETWEITFESLESCIRNSKLFVSGTITTMKNPLLSIRGSLHTDVNELKTYLPANASELIGKLETAGAINSKFIFNGRLNNPDTWQIDLKTESPQLRIKKWKFDEVSAECKFKNNQVSIPSLNAKPYGGILSANLFMDFSQANPQYLIQADIREIDISKLKNDTEFKDKDLSGFFYANGEFSGLANNIETLKGKGAFAIAQGKVWELPVFAGLANILYIPGVKKIIFREAKGTFSIVDKSILTDDTELYSTEITLAGNGRLDFNGNLNFEITAAFAKELLSGPTFLGPLRDFFVDEAGNFIGRIKLSGTLKEPKFKVSPFQMDNIMKSKLMETIRKKLFGNGD